MAFGDRRRERLAEPGPSLPPGRNRAAAQGGAARRGASACRRRKSRRAGHQRSRSRAQRSIASSPVMQVGPPLPAEQLQGPGRSPPTPRTGHRACGWRVSTIGWSASPSSSSIWASSVRMRGADAGADVERARRLGAAQRPQPRLHAIVDVDEIANPVEWSTHLDRIAAERHRQEDRDHPLAHLGEVLARAVDREHPQRDPPDVRGDREGVLGGELGRTVERARSWLGALSDRVLAHIAVDAHRRGVHEQRHTALSGPALPAPRSIARWRRGRAQGRRTTSHPRTGPRGDRSPRSERLAGAPLRREHRDRPRSGRPRQGRSPGCRTTGRRRRLPAIPRQAARGRGGRR